VPIEDDESDDLDEDNEDDSFCLIEFDDLSSTDFIDALNIGSASSWSSSFNCTSFSIDVVVFEEPANICASFAKSFESAAELLVLAAIVDSGLNWVLVSCARSLNGLHSGFGLLEDADDDDDDDELFVDKFDFDGDNVCFSFSSAAGFEALVKIRPNIDNIDAFVDDGFSGLTGFVSSNWLFTAFSITILIVCVFKSGGKLVKSWLFNSSNLANASMPLTDMELGISLLGVVFVGVVVCDMVCIDWETDMGLTLIRLVAVSLAPNDCVENEETMLCVGEDSAEA
jgi:hypothetical protein